MINTYQSTVLDSVLLKAEFTLSESLKVVDGFVNKIQDEIDALEQTASVTYSEEDIQFIAQSLENWFKGSISLKDTIQKNQGNFWASALVTTIVITAFTHIVNILIILYDHQIQQERKKRVSTLFFDVSEILGSYRLFDSFFVEKLRYLNFKQ